MLQRPLAHQVLEPQPRLVVELLRAPGEWERRGGSAGVDKEEREETARGRGDRGLLLQDALPLLALPRLGGDAVQRQARRHAGQVPTRLHTTRGHVSNWLVTSKIDGRLERVSSRLVACCEWPTRAEEEAAVSTSGSSGRLAPDVPTHLTQPFRHRRQWRQGEAWRWSRCRERHPITADSGDSNVCVHICFGDHKRVCVNKSAYRE